MAHQSLTQTQQSLSTAALPGTWKLVAGRAISLRPQQDSLLRVAHGQLWLTFEGRAGDAAPLGDHFLQVGEQFTVPAGQHAVIEPLGAGDGSSAYFSWEPLAARVQPPVRVATRWQLAVVQPLADLRLALVLGLGATGRLVLGLLGLAGALAPRRERAALPACTLSAQAKA